jgi:hypothetical protein
MVMALLICWHACNKQANERPVTQPGGFHGDGDVDGTLRRAGTARTVTREGEQHCVDAEKLGEQVPLAAAFGQGKGVGDHRASRGQLTGPP